MGMGSKIRRVVEEVAVDQEKPLGPLSDDTVLADSGLDSLCFAIIVARLEDELGVDPFTASDEVVFPITFRDLVELYENGTA